MVVYVDALACDHIDCAFFSSCLVIIVLSLYVGLLAVYLLSDSSLSLSQVFVEERSKYAGQPVGLVVAQDRDTAVRAAQMVMVGYEDMQQPVLTIKDALAKGGRDVLAVDFITGKAEPAILGDPEGISPITWTVIAIIGSSTILLCIVELIFYTSTPTGLLHNHNAENP